jgi:[acyl-carrier-protein] S-malonyltransferase
MEKIAFLFAGQGAQHVGMGKELYAESPAARAVFDDADRILGLPLSATCFEGPEATLTQTAWCQPGIFVHSMAALAAARAARPNLACQAAAGLSLGEFTALAAAGWMRFEDALRIVRRRGQLMQEACDRAAGAMASIIGLDLEPLRAVCAEAGVDVANLNCPGQIVISGEKAAIASAIQLAKARGAKRALPLAVAGAYHSRLMKPAAEQLAPDLAAVALSAGPVPVVGNVTALPHEPGLVRQRLVEQVTSPVRWEESMRALLAQGFRRFVEFGPGEVLAGLMRRIDPAAQVASIGRPADLGKLPA